MRCPRLGISSLREDASSDMGPRQERPSSLGLLRQAGLASHVDASAGPLCTSFQCIFNVFSNTFNLFSMFFSCFFFIFSFSVTQSDSGTAWRSFHRPGAFLFSSAVQCCAQFTHSEPNFHYPPSLSQRVMNFFRLLELLTALLFQPRGKVSTEQLPKASEPQSAREALKGFERERSAARPPPELTTLRKRTRSLQGFRRRRAVVLDQRALAEGLQKA